MNNREKKIVAAFPDALDAAVNEKFPEAQAKSSLDICSLSRVTVYAGTGSVKKQIKAFNEGFIAGNLELRTRLEVA